MSLSWKYQNKVKVDYKARLEYKLYLARENPEPVFDVSNCALKSVPSGIYLLCKVFRKEALYMQCNRLSSLSGGGALSDLSLITILDLHKNELNSIPPEIRHLVSIKEMYLQENNIRKLPYEIGNLINLSIFNVSKNCLKCLPDSIGFLKNLINLDISDNKSLQVIPKSLGYAQRLEQLGIDNLNISYPPMDILVGGAVVVVAFLAKECEIKYLPEEHKSIISSVDEASCKDSRTLFQNNENNVQEQKQHTLLKVENNIKQQQEIEFKLQFNLKTQKQKLLEDLSLQQMQLEREIEKIQQERDVNREKLLSFIYNAEKDADNVITEFLKNIDEERQTQTTLAGKEKQEEMELLYRSKSEQFILRKRDTILAMEKILDEEYKAKKFAEYAKFRDYNVQSILNLEIRSNEQLAQIMQDRQKNRQYLINRLGQDEVLQKLAVATLLERSDTRSWSIVQQVNLVQSQLATLTNIELERRKFKINQQLNDIANKRVTLSIILMDLLNQQEKRREQLLKTIQQIEEQNISNRRKNSSFWLMQYQSLMETRPQGLLETLEPNLVRHVAIAGALHCLPFLSSLPSMIDNFCAENLEELGIHNEDDQKAIKLAVENYLTEKKLNTGETVIHPSALEEEASSSTGIATAPSEELISSNNTECIICMDAKCEIIFLSCGHLCCCANCADNISSECPLCRTPIDRKIRFLIP